MEDTSTNTMLDIDALLKRQKIYKTDAPEVSVRDRCDSAANVNK